MLNVITSYSIHYTKLYEKGVDDPFEIDLETSIERILTKREEDAKKTIKIFEEDADLQILDGRWGPFIKYQKGNYKIPKDKVADDLTFEECQEIIKNDTSAKNRKGKTTAKKVVATKEAEKKKPTTTKKATVKKTTAKKSTVKNVSVKKTTAKKS